MTSAQAGASRIASPSSRASPPFSFPSCIAGRPSNVRRHATQSLTAILPLSSRLLSGGVRDATIGIWPSPQPCIGSLNKIAGGVTLYWRCQCHPEPPAQPYVSLLFERLDAPDQHSHRPCPGSSCHCEKKQQCHGTPPAILEGTTIQLTTQWPQLGCQHMERKLAGEPRSRQRLSATVSSISVAPPRSGEDPLYTNARDTLIALPALHSHLCQPSRMLIVLLHSSFIPDPKSNGGTPFVGDSTPCSNSGRRLGKRT